MTKSFYVSLKEIQFARGIMNVLAEMLNAVDPGNKEVYRNLLFVNHLLVIHNS